MNQEIQWPDNKKFAFTIFDDTDRGTISNVPHVYSFLDELGFKTTKSVWPSEGTQPPCVVGGSTCADKEYASWVQDLQRAGFEIGYHNNTFHSSTTEEIKAGLKRFRSLFDHYPKIMANHTDVLDGMYWGANRFSNINRIAYIALKRFRHTENFGGHQTESPHFWGDLCQQNIKYCRNFVFGDMNTLKLCPDMPYHDPDRPFVNYWYASSEGGDVSNFNRCISEANQDRLEKEGGACIMYTHFGKGFYENGTLNPRFKELMERLSKKDGWFVPTSTLLDFLLERKAEENISRRNRNSLERRWLRYKILGQ